MCGPGRIGPGSLAHSYSRLRGSWPGRRPPRNIVRKLGAGLVCSSSGSCSSLGAVASSADAHGASSRGGLGLASG
jgi:hypothetical protein